MRVLRWEGSVSASQCGIAEGFGTRTSGGDTLPCIRAGEGEARGRLRAADT